MEDPTEEELEELVPSWEQIVYCTDDVILPVPLNNLLGAAIHENPLPWKNIFGHRKKTVEDGVVKQNFVFAFQKHNEDWVPVSETNNKYDCPSACINDGIIRFLAVHNSKLLSKVVFSLIESQAGRQQSETRDYNEETYGGKKPKSDLRSRYYILYRHWPKKIKTKHKHRINERIAVVRFLTRDTVVLVLLNGRYTTEKKECFLLHRYAN